MRIYVNAEEAFRETERDLFEMGQRVSSHTTQDKNVEGDKDYETVELFGYGFMITKISTPDLAAGVLYLKGNLDWAGHEFSDRTTPVYLNPGSSYKEWPDLWEPLLRDGQFAYTYNERLSEQLPQAIRELTLRPHSRQVVVTMYDRHQDVGNWGGKDRVPCSLHWQLAVRDNALHMIYSMRSCDFLTHFCHDVYFAGRLLMHVAGQIGVEPGHLTCFFGSLHAYRKDMKERGIF